MHFPSAILLATLLSTSALASDILPRANSQTVHCSTSYGKSVINQRQVAICCSRYGGKAYNNRSRKIETCSNLRTRNRNAFVKCVKTKKLNVACAADAAQQHPYAAPRVSNVAPKVVVPTPAAAAASTPAAVAPMVSIINFSTSAGTSATPTSDAAVETSTPDSIVIPVPNFSTFAAKDAVATSAAAEPAASSSVPVANAAVDGTTAVITDPIPGTVIAGSSDSTCQAYYTGLTASDAASTLVSCCSNAGGLPLDDSSNQVVTCSSLSDSETTSFGNCAGNTNAAVSCVA